MSAESNANPKPAVATEGELPIRRFSAPGSTRFGLDRIWVESQKLQSIPTHQMALQLGGSAWKSFAANPLTAFLSLLTISIMLALFGALVMLLQNISSGVSGTTGAATLRLFLYDGVEPAAAQRLRTEIAARPEVQSVQIITKEDALVEFKTALGEDATLLDGLENQNPLPQSLEVSFANSEQLSDLMERFALTYRANPQVQQLQYSQNLAGQLAELIRLVRLGGALTLLVMGLVTAFVVATTIRLALYSHRQEIQIMRLVGARWQFIRAPFLIEGVAQGVLGSVVALGILLLGQGAIARALAGSELAQVVGIQLAFLSPPAVAGLLLLGPLLGFVGSFLAVRRFEEDN
jgi:cell division transport system permease protein